MGLRASSETVVAQWKRVNSANNAANPPKLTVTYNYRPRTGTKQEAGPPFLSYAGVSSVNTLTPTLRDTFVDPNGDKINGTFQIFDTATDTQVGNVIVAPYVSSGQAASVTVPAGVLANGKTYKFRTTPYDGTHYNLGWSAWKTFTVDTTAPAKPSKIVSTDYPTDRWVKGAGQKGSFTVTPPAGDHQWLEWSLDGDTFTKVATGGATADKTLDIPPPRNGSQTLLVRAVDKAENRSDVATYRFQAGPGALVQPWEGDRTARRLQLAAEADGARYSTVAFSWRRSEADAWVQIPVADMSDNGGPVAAWPVALTAGKSPTLTWNAASTVNPDGSVEIKADFGGPGGVTGSTDPVSVTVDRNAEGAASQQIGPGAVNLLTGDFSIVEEDTSRFDLSVNRAASSRTPEAGAQQEGQAPIFGPAWVAGTVAQQTETDFSYLRKVSDTAVDVVLLDDSSYHFTAKADRSGWIPEPGLEDLTLKGTVTTAFTLSDTEGAVTEFTKASPAAPTWQVSSSSDLGQPDAKVTLVSETITAGGKTLSRPKKLIAPSSVSPATCSATPSVKGCKVIEYVYASATTASGSTLGDVAGQVKEIRLWSTAPGAATATAKPVQRYLYDAGQRLREAWDPQISPSLKTEYSYDTAGRIVTFTEPGEFPWTFAYGRAGNDPAAGEGMLLKATRPGLKPGTTDVSEGNASTAVVYDVPVTGTAAPYSLAAAEVKKWGQARAPLDATAVFPADAVPSSHSGSALEAADYQRATVHYLDVSGRETNTATPGGHLSATDYDSFGNVVGDLSAANRSLTMGLTANDRATQADLGIAALAPAERAALLSTRSLYDAAGQRRIEQLGPLSRIELSRDLKSGSTVLIAAGSPVIARARTVNEYDTARPDDLLSPRDLLTRTTVGAQTREYPDLLADASVTDTRYDWSTGSPTAVIQDPNGLAITTSMVYDGLGRVVQLNNPGSTTGQAGTQITTYWSATGTDACAGRPEWDGMVCSVAAGGPITGAGTNPTALPTTTIEYDWWGNPAKTTESANGKTRVTDRTYDPAGRPSTTKVTGGVGQAVPESTTEYDPLNGEEVRTTSPTAGTITRSYDKLGRQISYTDADGGVTTKEYDLLDRPSRTTDNTPSMTTYTYDHTAEPRGLLTKSTDSVAGAFTVAYDANGQPQTENLPGGYTLREVKDPAGMVTQRTYTRDSDGTTIATSSATQSVQGRVVASSGWSDQAYRYDAADRLIGVDDTVDSVCTRRTYTLDSRSNRTAASTATAAPGADCTTTGATSKTTAYDTADRIAGSGHLYDEFGRTTTLPGSTVAYYANDLAYQQTSGGKRQTWQLDANLRFRSWTVESGSGTTWTQTAAKVNHYSSDDDSPRWITEDKTTGALTRNVAGAGGGLAATTGKTTEVTLQFTNIHGDVSLQLPLDGRAPTAQDSDENGAPRAGQAASRYAWLGSKQRSAETLTGLSLMGVRLYDGSTGRFLQTDPVFGGNCNAYDYGCADPVNAVDLDGRCGAWGNPFKKCDKWRIIMWSRSYGYWYRVIREGSKTKVSKKYPKFGLEHIKDRHVGKGKPSSWRNSDSMISDLKNALTKGNPHWQWGTTNDGKVDFYYSYWKKKCSCSRNKTKYTVFVAYRTTHAPDGKPIGVMTAYINPSR